MKLTPLLTDHAMVQRHQSIPIWGWTEKPRTRIKASLGPSQAVGISGDDARFLLRLPALPAGGPHTLVVETLDGGERVEARGILVGEVWFASGQSNMEWTLADSRYTAEIAAARPEQIRMFKVAQRADLAPQSTVTGAWAVATPATIGAFSAVANFFAQRLQDELGIPVGVINSTWGGSFIETWISRERLLRNPATHDLVQQYEQHAYSAAGWEACSLEKMFPADPGNEGVRQGWHQSEFDDGRWPLFTVPDIWQNQGHNYSAVMWFRRRITLPESLRGQELILHLGAVDKQDITYVNGVEVGRTGAGFEETFWNQPRHYRIPAELTRQPELLIAVRAYSFRYGGGLIGPAAEMRVEPVMAAAGTALPLAGEWRCQVEHNFGFIDVAVPSMGHGQMNSYSMLFENMVRPLLPVGIAGAIWYQGESNAGKPEEYASLLRDLIEDWRFRFGCGDFPFGIVQLTSWTGVRDYQPASTWARLREAQQAALDVPGTGLAVILDAGDAEDIHPKDKKTVGLRLAQWALARVYGRSGSPGGPLYRGHRIEGSRLRVLFDQAENGLALRDGDQVRTLMMAGRKGEFVPARSSIEGASLVVWHAEIPEPVAVRYAWADNPGGANLVDPSGYPAGPFRTDGIKEGA